MNKNFRKALLPVAIATLISAPAWSDATTSVKDEHKPHQSQTQSASAQGAHNSAVAQAGNAGTSRARHSSNELLSRTPDELSGMNVIGPDGESVGKIKSIVMGRDRDEVHAVISSGGFLSMGSRDTLIPLAELTLLEDDVIQAKLTQESIAQRPEFNAAAYGVMESDRRISDFSAFEPTQPAATATSQTRGASNPASRASQTMQTNPLHLHTPNDLEGMEVIGSDRKKIGEVKAIVSRVNESEVHAVISSGGFLGIGATEILVPLDKLKAVGNQLQAEFSHDQLESQPKYETPQYVKLDNDRPISDFYTGAQAEDRERRQTQERTRGQLR
ncbi:MAG: PRC-barrel domain-containing protein [Wenzhouxiangella sp.]